MNIDADVIVTQPIMDPSSWGLYSLYVMQVCAYCEVPPPTVEARANELNPAGNGNEWKIIWGTSTDPDDPINTPNKAPTPCEQAPGRIHYLLSC